MKLLGDLKIARRAFARLAILHNLVKDLLALCERMHPCTLHSGDVDENICAAIIRLNEAKTFGEIKPLNGAGSHNDFLSK